MTKCPFLDRVIFLDTTSVKCFNEAISECEDVSPGVEGAVPMSARV